MILSKRNRFNTANDISAEINRDQDISVSVSTVKRRLRERGLFGRVAVKKPYLREENRKKRLKFAQQHKNWSIQQWKSVLWSDESKFEIFGSKRQLFVRRNVNELFNPACIVPTVKFVGGSVNVWGYFAYSGAGSLFKINGIMCKEHLKHTANLNINYLKKKEEDGTLKMYEHPPQSPDLNPIELLWEELDREVRKLRPTSKDDLWNCLNQAWANLLIQCKNSSKECQDCAQQL